MAIYDPSGWKAVGYYHGARFKAETGKPRDADLQQMAVDVFEMAERKQIAPQYRDQTLSEIEQVIANEFVHNCWIVPTEGVVVFERPTPIPKKIFNPGTQRMKVSFNLSEDEFNCITNLDVALVDRSAPFGQAEGQRTLKLHQSIERNASLISAFKRNLTSFACTVCNFDFEQEYGQIGNAFIECHHTIPVAMMRPGQITEVTDLVAVCSNCHRMLHKAVPMLTVDKLRDMRK